MTRGRPVAHASTAARRGRAVCARRRSRRAASSATCCVYRRTWMIIVSGFFEPLFYLLSIGVGIGKLVGDVAAGRAHPIDYATFVAPALLASSAMNGAVYDSTMNVFFKLKHAKVYDAVLATPVGVRDVAVGEIAWALIRGAAVLVAFLVVMVPWAWSSRGGPCSRCRRAC